MDYDDLRETTTVPSVSFKTVSLSSRGTFSTTLSIPSEQESKRDSYLPFENGKRNKNAREASEKSKTESADHPKSNRDDSRRADRSARKPTSALCKSRKELNDRMNEKISAGSSCAVMHQFRGETSDLVDAPFIELGAVYKILDFITDSDPNVSSLTSSCCNEISRILRGLLAQSPDKTLEDLLLNDSSLHKCERCGVISYTLRSYPEDIKETEMRAKRGAGHDRVDDYQGNERSKTPAGINNNARLDTSFVDDRKIVDRRVRCKHGTSNGTRSSPVKERTFVMRSHAEGASRSNDATTDVSGKIKDKSLSHNDVRRKCLVDGKTLERQTRYECNESDDHRSVKESLITARADTNKEEIVREISYEPKSKIDDLLAGIWYSENAQNTQQSHGDITAVTDTVKYLARGAFATSVDKQDDELLSKLQNRRCARLANASRGQGSILYGSRNDYPHRSSGFWLFDESGNLPKILDDYHPTLELDRDNARFVSNLLRRSNTAERIKRSSSWSDCLERDSLEDCTRLRQRKESDTVTFSSSSAENLIQEWIGTADRSWINDMDDEISLGRQLVSSRPSLDIARHVKAEIAKDSCFDNAKLSMLRARDSNIVARLASEMRTKICRLIQKMMLLDAANDSTLDREDYVRMDALKDEELRSVDLDEFANFDNQTTSSECTNDRAPTKARDSSKNGDHPLKSSITNSANARSQDLNKSENSVRIPPENVIIPDTSATRIGRADSCRKIARRIIYKDTSSGKAVNENDGCIITKILPIYREILESSRSMEWDSFQELVEDLHPDQKEIWRTICRTINEEAKRERVGDADGNMEVCIEISPVSPEEAAMASKITTCTREIVFEVDMTLKDVENFLGKKLDPIDERRDARRDVASCGKDESRAKDKS